MHTIHRNVSRKNEYKKIKVNESESKWRLLLIIIIMTIIIIIIIFKTEKPIKINEN